MANKRANRKIDSLSSDCNQKDVDSAAIADQEASNSTFAAIPIAAIGASAGGLEPIEKFFDAMPVDSGCAFVIVQHLSPDFRSLMDELLARHSSMNIHRIVDGMEIEPNSIYLNTPRTVMTIEGNRLQVEKVDLQNTVYLPIDLFFGSLAKDRGADAIGLVLSGTGSDGTKGSQSIKNAGGTILVQDPTTTRFDSMPRSVIKTATHSAVASPQMLAQSVQLLLNNETLEALSSDERLPLTDALEDVLSMLKHSHGTDFLQYKEATIHRRIERRAQMRGITDINDYRDVLEKDDDELLDLYADLLIEVTEFFRDQAAFEILQKTAITELTKNLKDGSALRVWVPGCASGEEAYSIAILLQEQARSMGIYVHLKIMATDIHVRSMSQASSGVYKDTALRNVPTDLVDRYFDCADGQAQIKPNLRNMVFFSTHDVTRDPPFTRIDLISCRNLLIYLNDAAQEKVMHLLHFGLRKDGYLFLGPSEHIGKISHEFDPINEKWRIFRKRRDIKLLASESIFQRSNISPDITLGHGVKRTLNKSEEASNDETVLFKRAHRSALETIVSRYAPPGFLLTDDGNIMHIFGNAGELIPLQAGSFSKRIKDLIRSDLKVIVTAAMDQARHKDFNSFNRAAYIKTDGKAATTYEVSLTRLELPGEAMRFLLLSIEKNNVIDGGIKSHNLTKEKQLATFDSSDILHQRISMLEHNLQSSEESLQSTIEELETSNEELQSTNEELMSANEEMQSTNEELHSVNEELYTVSAEHQRKNDELVERENDINVLLNSSKIGTVHLDENLCLRRYTANALAVFNILPQDIGRPVNHITIHAYDQDILGQVHSAKQENIAHESKILIDQDTYLVRIIPYESEEHKNDGVLITVIEVTDAENVRTQLADLNLQYHDIMESTESFVVKWDAKTNTILFCNEPYAQRWNKTAEELVGEDIIKIRSKAGQEELNQRLAAHPPNQTLSGVYPATFADGETSYLNITTRSISSDGVTTDVFVSTGFDCTPEYNYRAALEKLFAVFTGEHLNLSKKLEQILQIGLDYYSLDTATISMILGQTYEVTCVAGKNPTNLETGSLIPLQDTISSQFVEKGMSLAISDISKCELSDLTPGQKSGIESFVGASIHTACGPYGTVCFSSQVARTHPYSTQEENLCMLLGSWVGFLIGNQEQIEFMGNQNDYYNSIFLTVPTMMFLTDADGLIISASNRLCENLGLEPRAVPGKNCNMLFDVDNKEALKIAVSEGNANHLPLSFNLPDKSILETELNCTIKAVGNLKGVRMVVLSDVSDRNMVLRQSEDQNKRLLTANENLNQFAFIASHDLQEPLRKIQQFSNFLEEDLKDKLSGDAMYHLGVIVDASERMSTLIYDLLRYSGASQEEPASEAVSLDELLQEVEQELELSISETDAELRIGQLPEVQGDRALLRQLFVNLISNSIKYRAENRTPIITVNALDTALKKGIVVTDNGIGFDMEFAKKIFEPFNRLHNNNEYKGNGIGLAICSKVCEKHGWTLTAESKLDIGSKFIININSAT